MMIVIKHDTASNNDKNKNVVHDMILDMIVNHRNYPNHHEKSWETIRDHDKSWIIIHLWTDLGLWKNDPQVLKITSQVNEVKLQGSFFCQLRRGEMQITELWLLIIDENSEFPGHLELSDYFSSNASNWCPLFEDGVLNASSWVFWTDFFITLNIFWSMTCRWFTGLVWGIPWFTITHYSLLF